MKSHSDPQTLTFWQAPWWGRWQGSFGLLLMFLGASNLAYIHHISAWFKLSIGLALVLWALTLPRTRWVISTATGKIQERAGQHLVSEYPTSAASLVEVVETVSAGRDKMLIYHLLLHIQGRPAVELMEGARLRVMKKAAQIKRMLRVPRRMFGAYVRGLGHTSENISALKATGWIQCQRSTKGVMCKIGPQTVSVSDTLKIWLLMAFSAAFLYPVPWAWAQKKSERIFFLCLFLLPALGGFLIATLQLRTHLRKRQQATLQADANGLTWIPGDRPEKTRRWRADEIEDVLVCLPLRNTDRPPHLLLVTQAGTEHILASALTEEIAQGLQAELCKALHWPSLR